MLFRKHQDFQIKLAQALGTQVDFYVTREFPIESLILKAKYTTNAAGAGVMATANADYLLNIVKRVQVVVSDGTRTRNVVDATGPGILELFKNEAGQWDHFTNDAYQRNTAAYTGRISYPIFFSPPNMDDPNASTLLLPAPRFPQDIKVSVTLGSIADLDVNGAPTLTAFTVDLTLVVNRRFVDIANWPFYDQDILESSTPFAATLAPATIDLPIPGSFTGVCLRHYLTNASRSDITAGKYIGIQVLNTVLRRVYFEDAWIENELSTSPNIVAAPAPLAGVTFFDFLTDKLGMSNADLGSCLMTNPLAPTGAKAQVLFESVQAGSRMNVVTRRILGDIRPLITAR